MARSLPPEAQDVLLSLNASNEARLALLERRFTVPPSPAVSKDASLLAGPQHSVQSCQSARSQSQQHRRGLEGGAGAALPPLREHTPGLSHSGGLPLEGPAAAHSLDSFELDSAQQPSKRRRLAAGGAAEPLARAASARPAGLPTASSEQRGVSPPAGPQRSSVSPLLAGEGSRQPGGATPSSKQKQRNNNGNTISRYFPPGVPHREGGELQLATSTKKQLAVSPPPQPGGPADAATPAAAAAQQQPATPPPPTAMVQALEEELLKLRAANEALQSELQRSQQDRGELAGSLDRAEQAAAESRSAVSQRDGDVRSVLLRLATSCARQDRAERMQRLQQAAPRLGSLGVRRRGLDVQEVWEEGQAFKDLQARMLALAEQRESIEAARKAARKRLPLPGQALPAERGGLEAAGGGGPALLHPDDWVAQEEIFKARLAGLKREEELLRQDQGRLEGEKAAYIRQLKLLRDEEGSRFSSFPVLNNRYLLMSLLGRGGFSEVHRAFDLVSLREVACKIHQLSAQWAEAKKASYVKHAVREYHIHRELNHPRIVSLVDIFEIDNNTFATVLDLCEGGDLEGYCKLHEALPEKEARAVVAQVLSGLVHLNTKPRSVIHYDLKPANILFTRSGECKITDFGLSKVVDDGQTQGMELTSQGAGTYWYLPPECFVVKREGAPIISNKVDVWSLGVIFYQMLFGKRPFGHEQSQEQILRNEVMLNAREVVFPAKPALSLEAKDFIRRCLAYKQDDRMDVHAAAAHPYMSFKKPQKGGAKEAAAAGAAGS